MGAVLQLAEWVGEMKVSEAILRGFEKVNGNQIRYTFFEHDRHGRVVGCCVMGAASLGGAGGQRFGRPFREAWGIHPTALNDRGMPWEHIYGMAVAAGL